MKYCFIGLVYLLPLFAEFSLAKSGNDGGIVSRIDSPTLSATEIKVTTQSLKTKISTQYVEKEVAEKLVLMLSQKTRGNQYSANINPTDFIDALNSDLYSISHDKHLRVMFTPKGINEWLQNQTDTNNTNDSLKLINTNLNNKDNFGFSEVKIVDGNIGYLKLTAFYSPDIAKNTLATEMSKLSNTDAIIIDLRKNHGGSPEMVQLLSSYFFDSKPVHLNTFYLRPSNEYIKMWTLPDASIIHRPTVPLYILTSHLTFSAAEEFSYNLRNLKRATLIGEPTAGGAHAGDFQQLTDRFFVYMPFAKAINSITHTNWEGIGVQPHIKVSEEQAFDVAYEKALQKSRKKKH